MNSSPSKNIIEHYHGAELAQLSDDYWQQIIIFDQKYFDSPWPASGWEQLRLHPQNYMLSVLLSPLSGLALWWRTAGDDLAHLLKIVVCNPGQGNGRVLFAASWDFLAMNGVKKIFLEVHASNQRAIVFYQKWGLEEFPAKKHFYPATHPLGPGHARIFGGVIRP